MGSIFYLILATTVTTFLHSISNTSSQTVVYDLIIKDAKIIDGTGSLWYRGDIAVLNGIICQIGKIPDSASAREYVFANGSYLSPGFIDSHTHDDIAVLENPSHESKVVQGVTTVVTGNCGFSPYPQGQLTIIQDHLRLLLGDIAPKYFFADFAAQSSALTATGMGLNVASLVGHGPLRLATVGWDNRIATEAEIDAMCILLDQQLRQGAIGLSLGLVYPPSSYANLYELSRLAAVVQRHDRVLTAHVRSYEGGLLSSIEEFLQILRSSGARGILSHLQAAGKPFWNVTIPAALERLEEARSQEGIDVAVDMYPYLAGSTTILQLLPPSSMSGGLRRLLLRVTISRRYFRYLRRKTESGTESGWDSAIAVIGYVNVVISSVVNNRLKRFERMSISHAAATMSMSRFQFLLYIIHKDRGRTNVLLFQQSRRDNHAVFQSQLQMIGSDSIPRRGGTPHPRGYGTFPRVIGRYGRRDGELRLEEVVRKATSLPASRFGIRDRGLVVLGMRADLVLFSAEKILDEATYQEPTRPPDGIRGVWVNGVRVVGEDGGLIDNRGRRPGEVVRVGVRE